MLDKRRRRRSGFDRVSSSPTQKSRAFVLWYTVQKYWGVHPVTPNHNYVCLFYLESSIFGCLAYKKRRRSRFDCVSPFVLWYIVQNYWGVHPVTPNHIMFVCFTGGPGSLAILYTKKEEEELIQWCFQFTHTKIVLLCAMIHCTKMLRYHCFLFFCLF